MDDRSDRLMAGQLSSAGDPLPQFPDWGFREESRNAEHSLIHHLMWLKFLQCIPVLGCIGGVSNWVFYRRILGYVNMICRRACLQQLLEHQTKITVEPEWTILSVEIKPEGEAES